MASKSLQSFTELLNRVDQLIQIHGKLQSGAGRRFEQAALHSAGVVLAIAAWQAYIEQLLQETLEHIELQFDTPSTPKWASIGFQIRKTAIKKTISDFNTPNTQNVRLIFKESVDFDPFPGWEWRQGRRQWDGKEFRDLTDKWLKIRHTIVHGFPLPNDIPWIMANNGNPRINLALMKECRNHFDFLAKLTDKNLSRYIKITYGIRKPW